MIIGINGYDKSSMYKVLNAILNIDDIAYPAISTITNNKWAVLKIKDEAEEIGYLIWQVTKEYGVGLDKIIDLLLKLGTDLVHPYIWINSMMRRIKQIDSISGKVGNYIITDVKTAREISTIKGAGGVIIKIVERNESKYATEDKQRAAEIDDSNYLVFDSVNREEVHEAIKVVYIDILNNNKNLINGLYGKRN